MTHIGLVGWMIIAAFAVTVRYAGGYLLMCIVDATVERAQARYWGTGMSVVGPVVWATSHQLAYDDVTKRYNVRDVGYTPIVVMTERGAYCSMIVPAPYKDLPIPVLRCYLYNVLAYSRHFCEPSIKAALKGRGTRAVAYADCSEGTVSRDYKTLIGSVK